MDFYANPDMIYFRVTLTTSHASCKPVNSGQWVKKLQKQKNNAECLDVDLDFSGGKYCASLRLSLGKRGILEVVILSRNLFPSWLFSLIKALSGWRRQLFSHRTFLKTTQNAPCSSFLLIKSLYPGP